MALRTHERHKGGHSRSCGTTNCPEHPRLVLLIAYHFGACLWYPSLAMHMIYWQSDNCLSNVEREEDECSTGRFILKELNNKPFCSGAFTLDLRLHFRCNHHLNVIIHLVFHMKQLYQKSFCFSF